MSGRKDGDRSDIGQGAINGAGTVKQQKRSEDQLKCVLKQPEKRWKKWLTWIVRLIVGATFIVSGYVKGIDPWGTIFKIDDYLGAMGIGVWPTLVSAGAIGMCIFEFLIGVFILLGCFRRSAPILGLLFMVVMLPLTAWIWYAHPVSDCGCFGEAYIISDGATFWKNVALTAGFVWLLRYNRICRCLITPYLQWVATVVSGLFLLIISEMGYLYQPLVDYRPYPEGSPLATVSYPDGEDSEESYEFVYRKDGVEQVFSENDSLPEESDGWEFVETRTAGSVTSEKEKGYDDGFRIWNGDEDVTEEVIPREGLKLWLMMPKLNEVSIADTWQINAIRDWCERHGVDMAAIVNGSPEEIAEWIDMSLSDYPIYTAEDTLIKEVVRGKASLVYTVDGDIVWKRSLQSAWRPGFEDDTLIDLGSLREDNRALLRNLWLIYIALIVVLISLSFSASLFKRFSR